MDQCDECVDSIVKNLVHRLAGHSTRTDVEAALFQYLLKHSPSYTDELELQMLLAGVFDLKTTKGDVASLLDMLQKRLTCGKLIRLIEHEPRLGYRLSNHCALLRRIDQRIR